jgi:hypothetical protein
MVQIDTKTFFKVGIGTFIIIGFCDFANFIIFFSQGNAFSWLASVARITFDFVTAGFFAWLLRTTEAPPAQEIAIDPELAKVMKNFDNGEKNETRGRKRDNRVKA